MKTCFIVGCGRSGSTWLNELLIGVPNVVGGAENNFFHHIAAPGIRSYERGQNLGLYHYGMHNWMSRDEFILRIRNFWEGFSAGAIAKGADIHLDQTPHNGLYMKEIMEVVPNPYFIHLVRNPYDVALSMKKASKSWGKYWAPKTFLGASRMWNIRNRSVLDAVHDLDVAPKVTQVRYENLLKDTAGELRTLFNWLGLEVTNEQLDTVIANASRDSMKSKFSELNKSAATFVGSGHSDRRGRLPRFYVDYLTRDVRVLLGY